MNNAILTYEELQGLFGGSSPADLAVRLQEAKVKFKRGFRGRPFTTVAAMNDSMGITEKKSSDTILEDEQRTIEVE